MELRKDVTHVTLGQRIQELRKQNGLSQEALGEVLGVSRQAISKWESDLAVPEVDKLIAMCKRCGVPVGVLLGVEEYTGGGSTSSEEVEELSERELKMVETIVERYLTQAAVPKRTRRRWPWVLAGLALILLAGSLFSQFAQLDQRMNHLQNQVWNVNSTLSSQITGITNQVEEVLMQQNSLVTDWEWSLSQLDPLENTVVMEVLLTLRQYTPGMEVWVEGNADGEIFSAQAEHQGGSAFLAQMTIKIALSDELKLFVVALQGEERQTQLLEEIYDVEECTRLSLSGNYFGNVQINHGQDAQEASLTWDGTLDVEIDRWGDKFFELLPQKAEFRFTRNEELLWSQPVDLTEWLARNVGGVYDPIVLKEPIPFTYQTAPVTPGDHYRMVFYLEDNYGQRWEYVLKSEQVFLDGDGRLSMEEYGDEGQQFKLPLEE